MRVLVCGGRTFANQDLVFRTLDSLGVTFLMEGGADGADSLGWKWAKRNLPADCRRTFQADWSKNGRAAGPMRNHEMLEEGKPDIVVAFSGGKGTADMVRRANRAGVPVLEVEE